MIITGDALDLLSQDTQQYDLIATDPPYAFSGHGEEHALTATVAIVLREAARHLRVGGWMLVMSASSWRSLTYAAEAVRGLVQPIRVGTWCKPTARTKTRTPGWAWQTVLVLACRRGKAEGASSAVADWVCEAPIAMGRRAELPTSVADWMVAPYAKEGGWMLDPFAGAGILCQAAERAQMQAIGYEIRP